MENLIAHAAHYAELVLEAMALIVIVVGSIEAFVKGARVMLSSHATNQDRRDVWLRYGRWLVAGLTFQLASDIVHTAIAPSWEDIGRLGAIAVIRTFLSYFLERDMADWREQQHEKHTQGHP
jgi:uncharacterized membrane protein